MKHTTLSVGVFVLFTTLLSCSKSEHINTSPDSALPNIILLVGDDQGYPYFGFTGSDYIQTPNMDSLAASGIVFHQGYVSDNHCRPSLQTLLTSLLPIDFNKQNFAYMDKAIEDQRIPADSAFAYKQKFDRMALGFNKFETLPKLLAQKGYASFQGGKWWEFNYQNGGFTHGMTKGWTEEEQKTAGWFLKHMGGEGMDLARVTNQPAYDFLEETKGQPFFMWFAPSLPHYPFDAPAKYYDIYKDQDMSESAKQYYANCTWFDDAWGQLVEYLKAHELYENTLIVYVNDNGWEQEPKAEYWDDPQRSHNGGDKGKGSIYDLSFKTPIIFSFPNQIENSQRSDLLIHSADIPATILDYAGIEIPETFYGQSFKSIIEGDSYTGRPYIVGNVVTSRSADPSDVMGRHIEGYWVRKDNWFLRWHATDEEIELFDIQKDPFNNIDLSKQFPEIRDELKEIAMTYKAAHGADPRLAYYLEMSGK